MKSILLVDDDYMNCILAEHALKQEYQIVVRYSGKEALEYLEKETPDLILMDIEMPGMNGKEVVNIIKGNKDLLNIPVIFLTADSNPLTEAECLTCGADDFIIKPFVPDVMKKRIEKVLEACEKRKDLEILLEKNTIISITDALTGLNNRSFFEGEMNKLLADDGNGTLFMIDLDNFKKMNDTYGHMVGDEVLKNFADVLKMYARKGDLLCRLGGDEFVTFYKELTDNDIVAKKATDIIRTFAEKMAMLGYGGIVSVSIGAKITKGDETFEEIYDRADKTLYAVKTNGKNAYQIYDNNSTAVCSKMSMIDTNTTLDRIHKLMIQDMEENKGAFHVGYNEFKKMYDFAMRCVARNKRKVQTILFTINMPGNIQDEGKFEQVMDVFTDSVIMSLRNVDTGTRYSSNQYLLILMDSDIEDGKVVAERVIDKFKSLCNIPEDVCGVTFEIKTLRTLDMNN
ncbi:MAG: diguanylate cyclase [Lachnospiraceae bacterium]|nr:diguanylate cyclase [Lachnospiraceae bacterium]